MRIEDIRTVAVIGAGNMGHGIAQAALMAGFNVNLCDVKEEFVQGGCAKIMASLEKFLSKGKVSQQLIDSVKNGMLKTFTSIEEAVKDADMVAEAVPEIEALKIKTFQEVDKYARPEVMIATNTSSMSIQKFAESIGRKDKILGIHYFIPVVMMNLAEVIQCKYTDPEYAKLACDYVRKIGKNLVFAKKDTPGFIANRIFAPVIVYNSLVLDVDRLTPQDVDYTMRSKGALKMGPLELMDFGGIDVADMCQQYYHNNLSADFGFTGTTRKLLDSGCYGKKVGKGYYTWPEDGSRPSVTEEYYTGKYDWELFFFIEANESTKLLEEGVCTLKDCDTAMIYGFNSQGPISFARQYQPSYIAEKLNQAAMKYNRDMYKPTETITSGRYLIEE